MTFGYAGRRVVVTGCASGIGAATAHALTACGAEVIGLDRHEPGVAPARFVPIDLADPSAIDAAAAGIGGRIDALFNCAGLAPTQPPLEIVKVNFLGTRHLTQRIIARMEDGGAIVSLSSNGGLNWRARMPLLRAFLDTDGFADGLRWVEPRLSEIGNAYRFAKEAVTLWTLQQSARLIQSGIRVNCISPGAVSTPMLAAIEQQVRAEMIDATTVPIGRRSTAEEQVGPLLFLNSDAASYVNGVDLPVDGGFAATVAVRCS